jgi:glycosyl transferase family 25
MHIPVLVINLDRSSDRLAYMREQAVRIGFEFKRVPAVDGLRVPADLAPYFLHITRNKTPIIDDGAVGCYASHLSACRHIVASQAPVTLVLEDDVTLPNDLAHILDETLNALPAGWDFVQLAKPTRRAFKPLAALPCGRDLVRYSQIPSGTHGYLISRAGAAKLLNPAIRRVWAVDTDTRRPWLWGHDVYGLMPPLLIGWGKAALPSTIRTQTQYRKSARRGLPRPTTLTWTNLPFHDPRAIIFNVRKLGLAWWLSCLAINCISRTQDWLMALLRGL